MFAKFEAKEEVSTSQPVKSSVGRTIRAKIIEQYPMIEPLLDELMPKKAPIKLAKCKGRTTLVLGPDNQVLFVQLRDGPFLPHLRLLHQYPSMLPHFRVDKGAIRHVLTGANIMCPGLTSAGGSMVDVPADTPVAVMAEGKEHALAVGVTVMSSEEIRAVNKDVAVTTVMYLNDGLWKTARIE